MSKPLKRIVTILIIIILLPAVFFSVYEIGTLSSSEKVIEEIYNNQLDAILYSVNQYSEDVLNSWISKINMNLAVQKAKPEEFKKEINRLEAENPIFSIFLLDDLESGNLQVYSSGSVALVKSQMTNEKIAAGIRSLVKNNINKIKRLYTYKRGGYRKIESVQSSLFNDSILMILLLDDGTDNQKICGIFIDPLSFVRRTLAPKLQEVAQGKFSIAVLTGENNERIFTTGDVLELETNLKKQLWLFPSYNISIALQGTTIQDLVRSRYYMNLILISVLNVVLIAGVWFVFRNIKKEIQLAQIKSDFVSNVSHELRTPLALISMFAETLEMGRVKSDERKKEYYGIISQEANRLSRIVNKILSFSQIEAGRRKYNFEVVDLNEIVNKIYSTYSFHMQNNGFKFSFEPDEGLLQVKADSEAISEVVVNLIDNAAKYSKDKKEISVRTGQTTDSVYIEVKDQGIGISDEDQKRIFDKFYRVTSGNVHNTKGTGLGLTLVKHIMEAHKGSIALTSSPGNGATFKLNFPVNNSTAA